MCGWSQLPIAFRQWLRARCTFRRNQFERHRKRACNYVHPRLNMHIIVRTLTTDRRCDLLFVPHFVRTGSSVVAAQYWHRIWIVVAAQPHDISAFQILISANQLQLHPFFGRFFITSKYEQAFNRVSHVVPSSMRCSMARLSKRCFFFCSRNNPHLNWNKTNQK